MHILRYDNEMDGQAELRVAIAQEVLAGLATKTIIPTDATYAKWFDADEKRHYLSSSMYQRPDEPGVAAINGYTCYSCGIGSIAVGIVRRGLSKGTESLWLALGRFFSDEELHCIEVIFMEGGFNNTLFDLKVVNVIGEAVDDDEYDEYEQISDEEGTRKEKIYGYIQDWKVLYPDAVYGVDTDDDEAVLQAALAKRLTAMMQNIVRNNGLFVLEDVQ